MPLGDVLARWLAVPEDLDWRPVATARAGAMGVVASLAVRAANAVTAPVFPADALLAGRGNGAGWIGRGGSG